MKLSRFCLFLALTLGSTLASATILVDRGLPNTLCCGGTAGANGGPAGALARSNVSWGNQDSFVNGDNFQVPVGEDWTISHISTWMVGDPTKYSNFILYGGVTGVSFGVISAPLPVITRQYYQPSGSTVPCDTGGSGADYLAPDGVHCFQVNKITFDVSNLLLTAGTLFNFAPDAIPSGPCEVKGDPSLVDPNNPDTTGCFYVHATNAALAGTPQQGSDNKYISFDTLDISPPLDGDPLPIDSNGAGWDKSSDINVEVEGSVVPEPSMIPFLLIGIVAIGAVRRRRK